MRVKSNVAYRSHDWDLPGTLRERLRAKARCTVCGFRTGSLCYLNDPCWLYEIMAS